MRTRIVIATLAVVAITAVVGSLLVVVIRESVQGSAETELARQAAVTARQIEEDLADIEVGPGRVTRDEFRDYRFALGRSLERARDLGGHDVVEAVFEVDGRVVPLGAPPTIPVEALGTDAVATVPTDEGNLLIAVEHLEIEGGILTVWIGRTEPLFPTGTVLWALLASLAVGATLMVVLAGWFVRSLSRRLGSIADTADAIRDGEFSARTDDSGRDEIGKLAAAFDSMADRLEDARDREREFLLAVGHDLRTPLTTIRGYAEALDEGLVPDDRSDEVAAALNRQTDLLSRLVEDVMQLARLESSEFSLEPEVVDVSGLIDGVAASFRHRAVQADIALRCTTNGHGQVFIDPDRLAQVVTNLLDNAMRYTPSGGSIHVDTVVAGGRVVVSVTNTGDPISPADLPHVFDRLYVAERYRSERPAGSGLGLAIVDDLVAAMGGSITCTSSTTEGTRFEVVVDTMAVVAS